MKIAVLLLALASQPSFAQVRSATTQEVQLVESSLRALFKLGSVQTRDIQITPSPMQGGYFVCGEMFGYGGSMQPNKFRKFYGGYEMFRGYPSVLIVGLDDENTNTSSEACKRLGM